MRELERAIGTDCRRLDDGRKAEFRHTRIRNRCVREMMERRDVMDVMRASYLSVSCIASNPRVPDLSAMMEDVSDARAAFVKVAFPYLDMEKKPEKKPEKKSYDDYSEYFDELDELEAMEAAKNSGEAKNDTIDKEK